MEGAIDVLVVVAALELLDVGAEGVGWLNAAWGVGGLVGGAVALGVLRRGRLSLGLAFGCVMAGTALALIADLPAAGRGVRDAGVLGVGYAWVEVAGLTLMQRLVSDEVLARVFGVVESTYVATTGLGGVVAPLAVALFGIEGALVAVGACLPLLAAADLDAAGALRGHHRGARAPVRAAALALAVRAALARERREPRRRG